MFLVPIIDLKFLYDLAATAAELQIGGTKSIFGRNANDLV